jgi:uncharacterized protein
MPDRDKCMQALFAHELAVGANPLGAEAARAAGAWWRGGPCVGPQTAAPQVAVPETR